MFDAQPARDGLGGFVAVLQSINLSNERVYYFAGVSSKESQRINLSLDCV